MAFWRGWGVSNMLFFGGGSFGIPIFLHLQGQRGMVLEAGGVMVTGIAFIALVSGMGGFHIPWFYGCGDCMCDGE